MLWKKQKLEIYIYCQKTNNWIVTVVLTECAVISDMLSCITSTHTLCVAQLTRVCVGCAGCSWIKTVDPRGMLAFIVDMQKKM